MAEGLIETALAADWCELALSGNSLWSQCDKCESEGGSVTVGADAEPCSDGDGIGRVTQSCEAERTEGGSVTVGAEAEPWLDCDCIGRVAQSGKAECCDLSEAVSESSILFAAHPSMKAAIVAACCDWPSRGGCLEKIETSSKSSAWSGESWFWSDWMACLESAVRSRSVCAILSAGLC
jgi:hypothetical protein